MGISSRELLTLATEQFEYLEYTNSFADNNEFLSLKISMENLLLVLAEFEVDEAHPRHSFYKVLMLSTPVMFDFLYNDYTEAQNNRLKKIFIQQNEFEEARRFYKFVRNALIHTNRYTHNSITTKIYRIEYADYIHIYFELQEKSLISLANFLDSKFMRENDEVIAAAGHQNICEYREHENIKFTFDYTYFIEFIKYEIIRFFESIEQETNRIYARDVKEWNQYFDEYKALITYVYETKALSTKRITSIYKKIKKMTDFTYTDLYILIEFLIFVRTSPKEIDQEKLDLLSELTVIDIYHQQQERRLLFELTHDDINKVNYEYKANVDEIIEYMNKIINVTAKMEKRIKSLNEKNYLIAYAILYCNF